MKTYSLYLVDDKEMVIGFWSFDLTEKGKLKFIPSGKAIKDAIKEHEERKNG